MLGLCLGFMYEFVQDSFVCSGLWISTGLQGFFRIVLWICSGSDRQVATADVREGSERVLVPAQGVIIMIIIVVIVRCDDYYHH